MLFMRQGMTQMGLGQEMYEAFKNGKEIPQADVEITDDDPPEVRRMKELIVEMTAYEVSDRPTIQQVMAVLADFNDQVRHTYTGCSKQIFLSTRTAKFNVPPLFRPLLRP